jgi:hypothetical protein
MRWTLARGAPPVVRSALIRIGHRLSSTTLTNLRSVLSYLELGAWLSTIRANGPIGEVGTDFGVFAMALNRIRGDQPVYLEFGVFEGRSMRWWSEHLTHPNACLVGFDSFEGLPDAWRPGLGKGHFGIGSPPQIGDPRVSFVAGWFEDTLAEYTMPDHDQLIVNIDCDLYGSASAVLRWLEPWCVPGTLIYFDELPDRDHEMRAFFESLKRGGKRVQPLAAGAGGLHWLFEYVE